ncbi:MAG: ABC transporter ATP-binding protein [Alphaproteobacteria bacterium]|nr:ABC transporter ATP-binding protein [Alphaproteobacteria bacterium]
MTPLVEARGIRFRYPSGRRRGDASWTIDDVDLTLDRAATLGIVGESGSGKSTLIRILCGLIAANEGEVRFDGRGIGDWLARDRLGFRARNQIVFQNPRRSLDPRMTVATSLGEPIRALERRRPITSELAAGLERVGLSPALLDRYPHQLSGGQLQRVAIARALTVKPSVLYADEPTSALDVSVQAQVLNLLMDLRDELGLTLVLVTHNLAVVGRLAERVLVLRRGVVVDAGATVDVLARPGNAYTEALVQAAAEVSLADGGKPISAGA